ncbi:MAG: hypothetical protein IJM89_08655 [Bacteroidales bacterium]|nr:hypothetical protein [Bacteroidales bacterium]
MIKLEEKNARMAMIRKYLAAETIPAEEAALVQYYQTHHIDEEENAIAQLLAVTHPSRNLLSDDYAREFDRIVRGKDRICRSRRIVFRAGFFAVGAVAAGLAILAFLHKPEPSTIDTVQILNGLKAMMELEINDIESITARPDGNAAILTVTLEDGSEKYYRMTIDEDKGTTSFASLITD